MGDYFDWWWKGGSWYDLQQREQIEALSLSQSRAAARLRSELRQEAKRSEDLATRLSRLEDAVVAIVELEDLRGVLDTFSDAVATRRYARDVLAHVPPLGRVPSSTSPTPPPDVPGYWLHPAVRSVDAALHGDAATQAAASAEARRRDPVRTAQFLAAVAILTRSDVADDDLATLFPTSRRVSTYQRALWLAVAEGGLGEEARRGLAQAIAWVLAQETTQPAQPEGDLVQVRMPGPRVTPDDLDEVVTSHLLGRRTPRPTPPRPPRRWPTCAPWSQRPPRPAARCRRPARCPTASRTCWRRSSVRGRRGRSRWSSGSSRSGRRSRPSGRRRRSRRRRCSTRTSSTSSTCCARTCRRTGPRAPARSPSRRCKVRSRPSPTGWPRSRSSRCPTASGSVSRAASRSTSPRLGRSTAAGAPGSPTGSRPC